MEAMCLQHACSPCSVCLVHLCSDLWLTLIWWPGEVIAMVEEVAEVNDTQLGSTGAGGERGEIDKKQFEGCLEVIAIH